MTRAKRIAVLGAGGFVGQAVVRAIARSQDQTVVHAMLRTGTKRPTAAAQVYYGDIRDKESVRAAVRGTDAVIHAASYVGYDANLCGDTNVRGTRAIVEACTSEGIDLIVYVSTAAVYGTGPHCGAAEDNLEIRPETALSRSRADAEQIVLSSGGVVLRPDMIFGAGDKWFGPGLIRLTKRLGGVVDEGSALMSVVHVDDLGSIIAKIGQTDGFPRGAYNVSYESPSSVLQMVEILDVFSEEQAHDHSIRGPKAKRIALASGFTERQFSLLTTDHWFDSSKLRSVLTAGIIGHLTPSDADRSWYRSG